MIRYRYQNRIGSEQRFETLFKTGNELGVLCKTGKSKSSVPCADFRVKYFPWSDRKRPDDKMFCKPFPDLLRSRSCRPVSEVRILIFLLSKILQWKKKNNTTDTVSYTH